MATDTHQPRMALASTIASALLTAGFTALCGVSHSAMAVVFGGLLAVTLALPPLANSSEHLLGSLFVSVASILSVSIAWLFIAISWPQWYACVLVLTAYAAVLSSVAVMLRRLKVHAVVSAAVVVIAALAWLSWPVWLSPYVGGRQTLVNDLVFAHPLLAINGELVDEAIWTERPQMYAWTALNQDVSYSMPVSVFWCVILHGGIASGSIFVMLISLRKDRIVQAI